MGEYKEILCNIYFNLHHMSDVTGLMTQCPQTASNMTLTAQPYCVIPTENPVIFGMSNSTSLKDKQRGRSPAVEPVLSNLHTKVDQLVAQKIWCTQVSNKSVT